MSILGNSLRSTLGQDALSSWLSIIYLSRNLVRRHVLNSILAAALFETSARFASAMEPYWEEYQAYCQQRSAAGLSEVTYRDWSRQWIRSRRTHKAKEDAAGPYPSTSDSSTRKRRESMPSEVSYTGAESSGYATSERAAPRWQPKAKSGGVAPQQAQRSEPSTVARPYPAQCLLTRQG